MTELIAAYPYGEPRCMEVTPDGSRVFLADGAVITVLNGALGPAVPIPGTSGLQSIEVPDAAPMALRYFELAPNTRQLFIAGGTHGPWRIDLCPSLFAGTGSPCADSTVNRTQVDTNLASPPKRCVDVEIVEGNQFAGTPLLFALFAANSNPNKSASPSVLRAYKLLADGSTPFYAQYAFDPTGTDETLEQVATALTWVPGDPNHVYVAMGINWLWEIDVADNTFSGSRLATGSIPTCGLATCPYGEMLRDVVGVRSASGDGFIYGALEYGRVLEYDLAAPTVRSVGVTCPTGFSRIECVSAIMDGDYAVVAVGLTGLHGRYAETRAPTQPTGIWNDQCYGVGISDPNDAGAGGCQEVVLLGRCTRTTTPLAPLSHDPIAAPGVHNTLILQGDVSSPRCYQSTYERAALHELSPGESMMAGGSIEPVCGMLPVHYDVAQTAQYVGFVFSAADGILSLRDPDLTYVGHDGGDGFRLKGRQVYLEDSPRDILPVPHTVSVCATRNEPIGHLSEPPCPPKAKTGDPNPFIASILGPASWVDPNDPDVEWFLTGGDLWRRADPSTCEIYDPPGPLPGECAASACDFPQAWRTEGFVTGRPDVGFKLVRMKTANPTHVVPDGVAMEMKWYQFEAPSASPEGSRAEDIPYLFSTPDLRFALADPGDDEELPVAIHGLRGGSKLGYKVFLPDDLLALAAADAACNGLGRGWGENLVQGENTVPYLEALTHVEFEQPGGAAPCLIRSCGTTIARHIYNSKLDLFTVTPGQGQDRMIAIVAAGFIATKADDQQPPTCEWDDLAFKNHPLLLTIYDVTNVPGLVAPPHLIRVAIGPEFGSAFAVRARNYPALEGAPTYAFVANFLGTLEVFEVSYDVLFNPTPPDPGGRYWPGHPILTSVASMAFDRDPYDGKVPNVVDIEIDGDFAYCALSRAGIAVVDIQNPESPALVAVLDTPGLAQGLMLRTDAAGHHQLLVGDARGGVRLYGVPGDGG